MCWPKSYRRGVHRIRVSMLVLVMAGTADIARSAPVTIDVFEKTTGKRMPARIHLKNAAGQAQQPGRLPFWRDHFVCAGEAKLELPADEYTIEVERGPEFSAHKGAFTLRSSSGTNITISLERLVDLAAEGWWSGDLHVHRPPGEAGLLMQAEDLHVAQFITWWNKQNLWSNAPPANPLLRFDESRFAHIMAGEDEREGGALLYFNLKRPLDITGAGRHFPSSLVYAREARTRPGVWIDMEKPFWWDFPLWIASGLCDSAGLANNHMQRSGMFDGEAWGKPRDRERFPSPHGNGLWTQEIYYDALNCGLRIPPSAGSASGVLPNPVGYNRVYVYAGPELNYEKWWDGLRAGQCFVSNGPLLRSRANGKLPGEVFTLKTGETLELEIEATLTGRDPVPAVEIIRDGRVVRSVPIAADGRRANLGKLTFTESGWFLVRAVASEPKTFRFASTAPFYVEAGAKPRRISKASAQFFLDWTKEEMGRVQLPDGSQKDGVLEFHDAAEKFWREILARANAE